MPPIAVDPTALTAAGVSVAAVGDSLSAAVSTLTGSFNANTGQDASGVMFGRQYENTARDLLKAVAAGVNACKKTGYGIQVSAANYSRAEAQSDISGRAQPLWRISVNFENAHSLNSTSSGSASRPNRERTSRRSRSVIRWSITSRHTRSPTPSTTPSSLTRTRRSPSCSRAGGMNRTIDCFFSRVLTEESLSSGRLDSRSAWTCWTASKYARSTNPAARPAPSRTPAA